MGKAMGGMVGLMTGGPFGMMIGAFVGHMFDQNLENIWSGQFPVLVRTSTANNVRLLYISSLCRCMGRIAKADGRVSEEEIAAANFVMDRMQLKGDDRQRAIAWFQEGKDMDCDFNADLEQLRPQLSLPMAQMFLEVVMTIGYSDGELSPLEWAMIERLSNVLGISQTQIERVRDRIEAAMFQARNGGVSQSDQLEQAYATLGVPADVDDDTLKKTYRRLMSQNHPDKLSASGMPEEMLRLAKEKTQQIQTSYALIRKSRGHAH
jgi:DnaJ like chaperone protein